MANRALRTTLVAQLRGSKDYLPICFTGHLDTVSLGASPWQKNPFSGETDGDALYGRGASDMKSGVAAMILAAGELSQTVTGLAEQVEQLTGFVQDTGTFTEP